VLAERQEIEMCFSPQGDLAAGIVVTAIGIDACRHIDGRKEYWLIAPLPLLLGLHQIDEAFVWWGLQGHVPHGLATVAMWIYLVVALVVLPVLIPLLVIRVEPPGRRRQLMVAFLGLGGFVSGVLLLTMLQGSPSAQLGSYHIAYSIGLRHGTLVIGLYIVATCGPLLASGMKRLVWFGVANLAAVIVLAKLSADGFTSLWCLYAALVSAAIALHLRTASTGGGTRSSVVVRTS
jgi:hypothetical protein